MCKVDRERSYTEHGTDDERLPEKFTKLNTQSPILNS